MALTATTTTSTTITGEEELMVHQEGVIVMLIWRNADMYRHMHALMDAHMDGVQRRARSWAGVIVTGSIWAVSRSSSPVTITASAASASATR